MSLLNPRLLFNKVQNLSLIPRAFVAVWRYPDYGEAGAAWPHKKKAYHHHKHHRHMVPPHTFGIQKLTRLRVVDNSTIGMEAMALGRPPKVIQVYSARHRRRPHDAYGKLGDRVKVTILGEMKEGIIVGMRANQIPGVPKMDTNNVVLINPDGTPLGTRVHVPVPAMIKKILKEKTHHKGPDYTKMLKIVTKFI